MYVSETHTSQFLSCVATYDSHCSTHCNTLQLPHTATNCNTLPHVATYDSHCSLTNIRYLKSSVLQCVAVCCSVLQYVAMCCSVLQCVAICRCVLQCAVCCSLLQCVAVCCSVLQYVAIWCSVLQCIAVYCSVLQSAAVHDISRGTLLSYSSPSNTHFSPPMSHTYAHLSHTDLSH